MSDKFLDKYRIESSRMRKWNYGWCGYYFVTICTIGRECFFGDIVNGKMRLSDIGVIVNAEWLKSPIIRPDMNLTLDEYIIMPNHIHGIIKIGRNQYNQFVDKNEIYCGDVTQCRDAMHGVSTTTDGVSITPKVNVNDKFGPQRNNLSSIIRGFKSAVTINARKINPDFGWQSRFYDNVIKDDEALNNIRFYIKRNPQNWGDDELNL